MIPTIILEAVAILAVGWVAGAEIGSWFGIQPIVAKLPYEQQVNLEQAMLKSFGRVMPVVMPFSGGVAIALAVFSYKEPDAILWLRVISAVCVAITILTTLTVNVPINNLTAEWSMSENFEKWTSMRTRWHGFQGMRGGLYLLAFILLVIACVLQRQI